MRTRVDCGIGWVMPVHDELADAHTVQRQALDAVADHVQNPEVQTIVLADFNTRLLNESPSPDSPAYDSALVEWCHHVTELLVKSSKTLVFRRHADRMTPAARPDLPVYLEPLTERERQVLSMACDGAPAREIGAELFISERTVESHISNGYRKLGIHSRIELVRRAAEFGL